jgi:hypothetical protein
MNTWQTIKSRSIYTQSEKFSTHVIHQKKKINHKKLNHRPIHPPSTVTISPLTYALPALANHTTTPLKSSGAPHLPAGILSRILFALASSFISAVFISVAIYPGAIAFTLIPLFAHSLLSAFVNWPTPPLLAAYAGTVMPPWNVRSDATLMMEPRRLRGRSGAQESMCAPTSRHSVKTDVRLTWSTAAQSSSGNSCAGCRFWMPPQLSRMWILWPSFRIEGTSADTEAGDDRSAVYTVAVRPRASIACLVVRLEVSRWR